MNRHKMGGIPEAVLNSGEKIPLLGLGTGTDNLTADFLGAFIQAIEIGYRHFDTAAAYGSEKPLGEAIAEAIRRGIIKDRGELFITSKLWCTDAHHDLVLPAIKKTLQNLGLEYLDLYLIHWPVSMKPGDITLPFKKEDLLPMDFKSIWEAMEECQKLGLTKSIGVSNFSPKKLLELMAHAKIPPAVNQIEMSVACQQKKFRDFCKESGIHVSAYSPLGAAGTFWGSTAVMESPILKQIAEARGKTIAQVALRWLHQQGVSVVAKSFNKERMKQNLQIFDWELSEQDLKQISEIPQKRRTTGDFFVSPGGPFKSSEELWDD